MKIIQTNVISQLKQSKVCTFLQVLNVSLVFSIILLIHSTIFAGIIGQDERVKKQAKYFPSTAIAKLKFIKNEKPHFCTAPLVASGIAVTSAHCLKGGRLFKFVIQGRKVKIKKLWVSQHHDFGFIFLSESIGYQTGWFALRNYHANEVIDKSIVSLEAHSRDIGFFEQKRHCSIRYVYSQTQFRGIGHDCDTLPGSSGAPLFVMQNQKAYLLGINSSSSAPGSSCSSYSPGKCGNIGVKSSVILTALKRLKTL